MICTCWANHNIDHWITHVKSQPFTFPRGCMFDNIVADVSSVAHTTPVVPVSRIEFAEDLTCNYVSELTTGQSALRVEVATRP